MVCADDCLEINTSDAAVFLIQYLLSFKSYIIITDDNFQPSDDLSLSGSVARQFRRVITYSLMLPHHHFLFRFSP